MSKEFGIQAIKKKWKLITPRFLKGSFKTIVSIDWQCYCRDKRCKCICYVSDDFCTAYSEGDKVIVEHIVKLHNSHIDNLKRR